MNTTRHAQPAREHRHGAHSDREALAVTAVLTLPCALAVTGSVTPGPDDLLTTVVIVLLGMVTLAVTVRLVARWVRERLEDRADTRTAAAWRVRHATTATARPDSGTSCSGTASSTRMGVA